MNNIYHNQFFAMNTRCNIVFPVLEHDKADRAFRMLDQEVRRIESNLSRFLPHSEISKVNQEAYKKPVTVSDEVFSILKTCKKFYEITEGAFDISLRPLMQHWEEEKNLKDEAQSPEKLMQSLGMEHINLDDVAQTIAFDNENIEIDLGGFGKGYALGKMHKLLQDFSVEHAFISFGESSILTRGKHPAGDSWKVGLNNYLDPGNNLYSFKIYNGSVSTSSNFYVNDEGDIQNHRHVVDPASGLPVEECVTVSVSMESPVVAEILSTAMLVSSEENCKMIKNKVEQVEIVKINYKSGSPKITVI